MAIRRKKKTKKKATKTATKSALVLPQTIQFNNYHEIDLFKNHLLSIIPGVKSRDLGMAYNKFVAVFYLKKDSEYKLMCATTRQEIENWWALNG